MAKYDQGGGCPCGLQKECDCKPHKTFVCPSDENGYGCRSPDICRQDGECHYTGSPFPARNRMNAMCEAIHELQAVEHQHTSDDKAAKALREILKITGATQDRPFTALSLIDGLAKEGLR